MERTIKRGDIYYADLNPVIGSEQGGTRPVLIISNDTGNKYSPTVIIALSPPSQAEYAQRQSCPRIQPLKILRVLAKTLLFYWSRYARLIRNG